LRSVDTEADTAGIRAWRDREVILQLPLVAVVKEVDAGVDALVANAPVRRDVRAPLLRVIADEVVDLPRLRLSRRRPRPPVRAHELHPEEGVRRWGGARSAGPGVRCSAFRSLCP